MKKILNVPYFSQRDNKYNPSGACNVTSIAMCLAYHGIKGDMSERQLEDQIYRKMTERGLSRHDPYGLKAFIDEEYPTLIKDNFTPNGTLESIRDSIDEGNPCVVHGYFTRFGHIIAIKGYEGKYFIVNDPWGEYFSTGYATWKSGEGLYYSEDLIARVCSPESQSNPKNIWLHKISKRVL